MNNKDDYRDDHIDDDIFNYLSVNPPKSFFMSAGAGSGKTGSLVKLLQNLREHKGNYFWLHGQKVAVITYTNAACDEIRKRLGFSDLFVVQTIHSFVWNLIKYYNDDMREWVRDYLQKEIVELEAKEATGRKGSNASLTRIKKITENMSKLLDLDSIKQFIYDPNGKNAQKHALSHSQVISISTYFLARKPLMQEILIQKYPVLLIDECQDTKAGLIDAFLQVQAVYKDKFTMGLFGDTMQRIYFDGKENVAEAIPGDWEKPIKKMNHRSQKRIVDLINEIRKDIDDQKQEPRSDKTGGTVRFFIFGNEADRDISEKYVAEQMQIVTKDDNWTALNGYKCLVLEHRMAAQRFGFADFFLPLYNVSSYKTDILDGSLSEMRVFSDVIIPLVDAHLNNDKFTIAEIVKKHSILFPEFKKKVSYECITVEQLSRANKIIIELFSNWGNDVGKSCLSIVSALAKSGLFVIPDKILQALEWSSGDNEENPGEEVKKVEAWYQALQAPLNQVSNYISYIDGDAPFNTHHGVKGLEFPRVMAIMDDTSAKGSAFQYEKLFGVTDASTSSMLNVKRLFYVVCSRAKESLALVAYTSNPHAMKKYANQEWFTHDEIQVCC